MIIKDKKRLYQRLLILCIIIGIIALAVAIIAVVMKRYVIAVVMLVVAIAQILNYIQWKKEIK